MQRERKKSDVVGSSREEFWRARASISVKKRVADFYAKVCVWLIFKFQRKKRVPFGGGAIKIRVGTFAIRPRRRGAYLSPSEKVVKVVVKEVVVLRLIGSFGVVVYCSDRRFVRAGDVEVAFVQLGLE